jgi:glycosyltransferase involved in cell wall biosynthesis
MSTSGADREAPRPLLSVVVPVFNQAASIVTNLEIIRDQIAEELGVDFEIIVVSDGSIDATEAELVARAPQGAFRVFHYDRNLGKGYAVKLGALEAEGEWIGFVDADLDLEPKDLARYVRYAQERRLDFAIGSKRHPESDVQYPRSRVVASWLFQQLVRLLFRLNVRDTQVGLKVFRRDIAEQVLPLLLVKRYAFDLELLAVANAAGFDRIEEMPVTLDYRFTGSGVRSRAVIRALVDTIAIFYRLRILHYYDRRRAIAGRYGWTRPRAAPLSVSLLTENPPPLRILDHPVEIVEIGAGGLLGAAERATADILAILAPRALPAANWLSATVPFFVRPEISAVVCPNVAPLEGSIRSQAAAAIAESRIGSGPGYIRYTPGNVRYVRDFPTETIVIRRGEFMSIGDRVPTRELAAALAAREARVLYTPETVVVSKPPPLWRPHLSNAYSRGVRRGRRLRDKRRALQVVVPVAAAGVLAAIGAATGQAAEIAATVAAVYAILVGSASAAATLRHRSLVVGLVTVVGIGATHLVYAGGLVRGLVGA